MLFENQQRPFIILLTYCSIPKVVLKFNFNAACHKISIAIIYENHIKYVTDSSVLHLQIFNFICKMLNAATVSNMFIILTVIVEINMKHATDCLPHIKSK